MVLSPLLKHLYSTNCTVQKIVFRTVHSIKVPTSVVVHKGALGECKVWQALLLCWLDGVGTIGITQTDSPFSPLKV